MFSTLRTVTCSVVVVVKVMTQAYVMIIAATAMTINRSVARIGDIPFLDFSILNKAVSPLANHFQKLCYLTCMNLESESNLKKSANDLKNKRRRRRFRLQSDTQQTLQKTT